MAVAPVFCGSALEVHWLGGGLYVESAGEGLVVDVPAGAVELLAALGVLERVQAVLLTSGRPRAVGGLLALLCGLERHRLPDWPLSLWSGLGEERGGLIAGAWQRGWPDRYPLVLDAMMPGGRCDIGAFEIQTVPVRHGEPRWIAPAGVEAAAGLALRIAAGDQTIAWVPGASPGPAVRRACRGADLAVVEVGVEPWPPGGDGWRMTAAEAIELAGEAGRLWLVGDDGSAELFGADGEN